MFEILKQHIIVKASLLKLEPLFYFSSVNAIAQLTVETNNHYKQKELQQRIIVNYAKELINQTKGNLDYDRELSQEEYKELAGSGHPDDVIIGIYSSVSDIEPIRLSHRVAINSAFAFVDKHPDHLQLIIDHFANELQELISYYKSVI